MPAATKLDLRIAGSIAELNKLANNIPKVTEGRKFLKTAEQAFKKAEEFNLQGDEESAYIMYMRYFNIISAIKKLSDYKRNEKFYKEMIGSKQSIKAITEAERLSESLKNRYEEKEAEHVSKKLEAEHIRREKDEKNRKVDELSKAEKAKADEENDKDNKDGPEQKGQEISKLAMSVQELYAIFKGSNKSILIMDIRPPEQFAASRINHRSVINVPSEILPPGSTVNYIEKALPVDSRGLWAQRADMDHLVMLDWRCNERSLVTGTTLASLKDALFKWDAYTTLKSEPVVLTGGYDEWLNYYPTLSTNANVERPPSTEGPTTSFSLDSIQYDFDEAFLEPPPEEKPPPDKLDQLRQQLEDIKVDNKPGVPSVDRSLKPSPNLNNSKGRPSDISSNKSNLGHLDIIKNQLRKDSSGDESYANNTLRTGDNADVKPTIEKVKLDESLSSIPTLPKVNNVPVVNRSLKPKPGSAEASALASAEYEAALKAREMSQQRYTRYKDVLKERETKIAQLKLEEERIEELKRKELAETAEVMRIKRRIQKQIDGLREEQAKAELEGQQRKEELDSLMKEETKKLELRREAERLRALKKNMKQEPDAANDFTKIDETPERSIKTEPSDLSVEEELERQVNDTVARQAVEREKRDMERREYERRKAQIKEEERKQVEQEAYERQEKEKIARETRQEHERQAEVKRLDRERTDREWIERSNKRTPHQDGGTPVSRPKTRDPITGSYTPGSPSTPRSSLRRPATTPQTLKAAAGTPTSRTTTPRPRTPASGIVPGLVTPENQGMYKMRLRDEEDTPRSGGMRRSHSSPNIAQLVDEPAPLEPLQPAFPNVDRGSKPRSPRPEFQMVPAKTEVSAAKVRNLQPTWGNVGRGLTGLRNLGNTCYMNSTIQCLSNTSFLTTYFLTDNYRGDINRENIMGKKGEVAEEFAVLIKALWTGQYRSINPRDFKGVISKHHSLFSGYDQQDSQEMLLFLLDGLHEDMNKVKKRLKQTEQENDGLPEKIAAEKAWLSHKRVNDSIIVDLFQGQFMSTLMCMKCEKTSVTFDTFMYLTVPIPSNTRCTLRDCLLHFAKEEKMTGDSQWLCPRCKCRRDATKRIVIYRLPRILLIHLKRFFYQGMWRQKINAHVDFPLEGLDLNNYVQGPEKQSAYNLYAVSNHYGTMEGGHYTAFCRSPSNSRWYKYDDHEVYDMSRSDTKSPAAYILYYTSIPQDLRFAS